MNRQPRPRVRRAEHLETRTTSRENTEVTFEGPPIDENFVYHRPKTKPEIRHENSFLPHWYAWRTYRRNRLHVSYHPCAFRTFPSDLPHILFCHHPSLVANGLDHHGHGAVEIQTVGEVRPCTDHHGVDRNGRGRLDSDPDHLAHTGHLYHRFYGNCLGRCATRCRY